MTALPVTIKEEAMKQVLRKTETRKTVLFALFVALVFVVMLLEKQAGVL